MGILKMRHFILSLVTLLVCLMSPPATGEGNLAIVPGKNLPVLKRQPVGPSKKELSYKISSTLKEAVTGSGSFKNNLVGLMTDGTKVYSAGSFRINERDEVEVKIILTEMSVENLAALQSHQVKIDVILQELNILQALVPRGLIETVAQLDFVRSIETPAYGRHNTGSTTTQGDALIGANRVRSGHPLFLGTDIKIAVLADGLRGWDRSIASGDLPAGNIVSCDRDNVAPRVASNITCPINDGQFYQSKGGEGTDMLEIIHDIAPAAHLYFAYGTTDMSFIAAVNSFSNGANKVDIIVDDVGFFPEPFYEDGPVAQAVQAAIGRGVHYVSSAGNYATRHIKEVFEDIDTPTRSPDRHHDFRGDPTNRWNGYGIRITPGATMTAILQWDDPFDDPVNNLDLYLVAADDVGEVTVKASSADNNLAAGKKAREELRYTNDTGSAQDLYIQIEKAASPGNPEFQLYLFSNQASETLQVQYTTPSYTLFGHPALDGAIAVGAVDVATPTSVVSYSSQGPALVDGSPRLKPDLVAPSHVTITGNGRNVETFTGTSASAPHVAGCLALLLEKFPNYTPAQSKNALMANATDILDPGFDWISGAGRLDCLAAVTNGQDNTYAAVAPGLPESGASAQGGEESKGGCSLNPSPHTAASHGVLLFLGLLPPFVWIKKRIMA